MGQLVNELILKSGQHNQEIDKAKEKVHRYKEEADKAGKSLDDMGQKQTRSAKDLLDAMSKIEGSTRSTSNYRSQLAAITRQIQDLTINYRAMDSEMQNSDFGREVSAKIQELTQRASEYKDAILDAQASVKALASDTANWDAAKQGIDVVSSSLQAFVSMGVLGEKSTEKLIAVIAKLKAMETATNAVIKVGSAIQKNSALMMGISRVQAAALARAKTAEAAATGKATIAQKLFNAVAKANPYVLLAAAVLSLVTALALFARRSKEVEKAAKVETEAMKMAREEAERYKTSLASTTADVLSKYTMLQIQWSKLRTEHEKAQWIKANANEFQNLGLKVKDLKSAEDAFVNNSANVVEALKKRAKAMANQNRLTQLYELLMQEEVRATERYSTEAKKIGDKYLGDINERNRHMFNLDNNGNWVYNAKGVEEENKKIKANCFATADAINGKIQQVAGEIAGELDMSQLLSTTPTGGGSGSNTNTITYTIESGSLKEAQNRVNELQEKLAHMSPTNEAFEKTKDELAAAKKEVERIQELLKEQEPVSLVKDVDYEDFSIDYLSAKVSEVTDKLKKMNPNNPEWGNVLTELNGWKAALKAVESIIDNVDRDLSDSKLFVQEMQKAFDEVQFNYDIGLIDEDTAKKIIENINKEFKNKKMTIEYSLELKATGYEKFLEGFSNYKSKIDDFATSISRAYDSIADLGDKLDEEGDAVKRFFLIFDTVSSSVSALQTVASTFGTLYNAISNNTKLTEQDTVATIGNTVAREANAGVLATQGAASGQNVNGLNEETTALAANTLTTAANTEATVANTGAKLGEASASATNTTANEAESGSVIKSAIAKMMEAIAGGAKAVASLGPIGPILAIAAAATITAALVAAFSKAKAQKFSTGGIYKGKSSVGDKGWARLNDGEMVLNTRQQKKLFQMLNNSGIIENKSSNNVLSGDVNFVIEADKLVGTLSNHNRKISHSKR